jgi:hypothetical protein
MFLYFIPTSRYIMDIHLMSSYGWVLSHITVLHWIYFLAWNPNALPLQPSPGHFSPGNFLAQVSDSFQVWGQNLPQLMEEDQTKHHWKNTEEVNAEWNMVAQMVPSWPMLTSLSAYVHVSMVGTGRELPRGRETLLFIPETSTSHEQATQCLFLSPF